MDTLNALAVALLAMWPVWAFIGILFAAMVGEVLYNHYHRKAMLVACKAWHKAHPYEGRR